MIANGPPFSAETVCDDNDSERYYGSAGAVKCLSENVADVAFVDHIGLHFKAIKHGGK